jgi:hypothetical protein
MLFFKLFYNITTKAFDLIILPELEFETGEVIFSTLPNFC